MEYIPHIPVEKWNLKEQALQLEKALKGIELSKVAVYKALSQYQYWEEFSKIEPDLENIKNPLMHVQEYEEKVKITISGTLPFVRMGNKLKDKDYFKTLETFYQKELTTTIMNQNIKIKFPKAFILIKQYFPDLKIRDFDNQFKSFIFNSLRYTKLISDDSWKQLVYAEQGELDRENPRTEIIVMDFAKMNHIFKELD